MNERDTLKRRVVELERQMRDLTAKVNRLAGAEKDYGWPQETKETKKEPALLYPERLPGIDG